MILDRHYLGHESVPTGFLPRTVAGAGDHVVGRPWSLRYGVGIETVFTLDVARDGSAFIKGEENEFYV